MTGASDIMLAILAAGQSQRFGQEDKLSVLLHGRMLGQHIADSLSDVPFQSSIIITGKPNHPCADLWADKGYQLVVNKKADQGQSTSVSLAAKIAVQNNASALCICLADMPFVTADHVQQLIASFEEQGNDRIIASSKNAKPMSPAVFPKSHFEKLTKLTGDTGARGLLSDAQIIAADDILMDVDTRQDLAAANIKNIA